MVVPVALILPAELQQMSPVQHGHVIAEEVVVPIPESRTGVLCIDVVRSEDVIVLLS